MIQKTFPHRKSTYDRTYVRSYLVHLVQLIGVPDTPSTWYSSKYLVPGLQSIVPGTRSTTPSTPSRSYRYLVLGVPGTEHQVRSYLAQASVNHQFDLSCGSRMTSAPRNRPFLTVTMASTRPPEGRHSIIFQPIGDPIAKTMPST